METKNSATFGTLVLLISDIAILDAIFMFFGVNTHEALLNLRFFPWMSLTILIFILYHLFLRKERTLLQVTIFLGVAFIITIVVMLVFFAAQPGLVLNLIAILFFAIPLFRLYFLVEEPPTLDKLIARFGAMIFVLLFALMFLIGTEESLIRAIPCAGVLILCLVALIVMRTMHSGADNRSGIRGAFVICAFLLLIGFVIVLFIAVSFGDALAAGAIAIWSGIVYLGNLILRFFAWLVSLLPMREFELVTGGEPMPGGDGAFEAGEMMDFSEVIMIAFLVGIIVAIAAIVVWFAIKLRKNKIGGRRSKKTIVIKKSKIGLQLKTNSFINNLKFFIKGIVYRNTPQGVFLQLERWGMLRRKGRAPYETPRNYLMRISDSVPEQRDALTKLADSLDVIWYGIYAEPTMTTKELASIRRAFI
jgi:hypothetical protein